jgi:hypothetical protein
MGSNIGAYVAPHGRVAASVNLSRYGYTPAPGAGAEVGG